MASCTEADVNDQIAIGNSTEISIDLSLESGVDSRVAIDEEWNVSWVENESLMAWGGSSIVELKMASYSASNSTFAGTISDADSYVVISPYDASASIGSTYCVDLSEQTAGMNSTYMIGDSKLSTESTSGITMRHIGGAMELAISYDGYDTSSWNLTEVMLFDVPVKANIPTSMAGVESLYDDTTIGDMTISIDPISIADATSVKFNILPFDVEIGEKLLIQFKLENVNGTDVEYVDYTATNSTEEKVSFGRAQYGTINCECAPSSGSTIVAVSTWDGESVASAFASGDGSSSSPYEINSAAELAYLASWSSSSTLENNYFSLEIDINLAEYEWSTTIGNSTYYFWGQFAGNGHTISGLSITGSDNWKGLFAAVGNNGCVSDLTVEGSVSGSEFVGGVAGQNFGVINNCINEVNVSASLFGGGVAGYNQATGTIINSANRGTVTANNHNGGIAGYAWGVIANCYNEGSVGNYDSTYYSGGIVGYCNATINNCYNVGSIAGVAANGGITGYNETGSVVNCSSLSDSVNSAQYSYGVMGVEFTAEQMSAAAFVSTLNNNAATYNAGSPAVSAYAWTSSTTYPVIDAANAPEANEDGYDGFDDSVDSDEVATLDPDSLLAASTDSNAWLAGSEYFVIVMDDTSYATIESNVTADFRTSATGIWSGYSALTCEGDNAFGISDASWGSYSCSAGAWNGLGLTPGASDEDIANLNARKDITDNPDEYYLHIALKASEPVTHMFKIESTGSAYYAIGNTASDYVDNIAPSAYLTTDGTWQHFDIPVTALTEQGLSFHSDYTATAYILGICSPAGSPDLNYDAVFFYKK